MRGLGDIFEAITYTGGVPVGDPSNIPTASNYAEGVYTGDYNDWYENTEAIYMPDNPNANAAGFVTPAEAYSKLGIEEGQQAINNAWAEAVGEAGYKTIAPEEQTLLTSSGSLEESVALQSFRNQYLMTTGKEPSVEEWRNSQQYRDFKSGKYRDQVEDLMVDQEEYDRLLVGGWSPYIQQAQTDPTFDILTAMATSDPTGGLAGSGAYNQWLEDQRAAYQEEQENILSSVLGQIGKERGRLSDDLMKLANLYA